MTSAIACGQRIRQLRLVADLNQAELAARVGVASGTISAIESGKTLAPDDLLLSLARVLDTSDGFLRSDVEIVGATRPWLRAYADAPKRAVDQQIAECELVATAINLLRLKQIKDTIPTFAGDSEDDAAVEAFAGEVRVAAQLDEDSPVPNMVRAAERLGCLVLPMRSELGRHVGLSSIVDLTPTICVSRPSEVESRHVPGDRQRFTVAHELGHLALHSDLPPPATADAARRIEKQAHLFAAGFLAPGDALMADLEELGGRVTLSVLADLKARWGVAIKALVMRFRTLDAIDADHARSLYKQISARGWNKTEPVPVGNEQAIWFRRAVEKSFGQGDPVGSAAAVAGVGQSHFARWLDWSPTSADADAQILDFGAAAKRRPRSGATFGQG